MSDEQFAKDREYILESLVSDAIADFFYYDRKEDDRISVARIEQMMEEDEDLAQDIIDKFAEYIYTHIEQG